jgi:glutamyl/glutaminyl-tRNA synthetase
MAAIRGSRLPVGSTAWITEERATALQVAQSEVEEFTFSVRNDLDWLNEHMAEIFDENEKYVNKVRLIRQMLTGASVTSLRCSRLPVNCAGKLHELLESQILGKLES